MSVCSPSVGFEEERSWKLYTTNFSGEKPPLITPEKDAVSHFRKYEPLFSILLDVTVN